MGAGHYFISAQLVGLRIRGRLLTGIVGITIAAYVVMHYIAFVSAGPLVNRTTRLPVGFLRYYDLTTRSMRITHAFEPSRILLPGQEEEDDSLGLWGYVVRVLEVGGFAGGVLCLPLVLTGKRYCDLCERYYSTETLAVIPACARIKKTLGIFMPRKITFDGEHAVIGARAQEQAARMLRLLTAGDLTALNIALTDLEPGSRKASKLPRRIAVLLSRCKQCGQGVFHPTLMVGLDARNSTKQELAAIQVDAQVTDALKPRK